MQTRTETRQLQLGDFNKGEHGCGHGVAGQGASGQGRTWQGEGKRSAAYSLGAEVPPPAPPLPVQHSAPAHPGDCVLCRLPAAPVPADQGGRLRPGGV